MADDDVSSVDPSQTPWALAYQQGYWAARHSRDIEALRLRHFKMQIRSRRDRLALILADDSQDWPPPAELTPWAKLPRDPPTREEARKILKLRARNGKHGEHHIAKQLWISWRKVKWVVDVFES
jgi:hypothetical protein